MFAWIGKQQKHIKALRLAAFEIKQPGWDRAHADEAGIYFDPNTGSRSIEQGINRDLQVQRAAKCGSIQGFDADIKKYTAKLILWFMPKIRPKPWERIAKFRNEHTSEENASNQQASDDASFHG
jgi:hypothetical protein